MHKPNLLKDIDDHFVRFYEETRSCLVEKQKLESLIVVNGDLLRLYREGHPTQDFDGLEPPIYDKLKTLSHIPIAIYCLLYDVSDNSPLSDRKLVQLANYKVEVETAASDLETVTEWKTGQLDQPLKIYDRSMEFMQNTLLNKSVSAAELASFEHSITDDTNAAVSTAARAQLDALHERVMHIKEHLLSADQWKNLRVVVLGPYMARKGELFLQYFSKVLGTPMQADQRLVYFEGADEELAFERLGTTILDRLISQVVFDDDERMHRDVLGDATTPYLKELLSQTSD